MTDVIAALTADAAEFDGLFAELDAAEWAKPTPAPGWTIAHQVGHLAFVFQLAGLAASDPAGFAAVTAGAAKDFDAAVNGALQAYVNDPPEALLTRWRAIRDNGIKALAEVPADQLVPWLVNPLPPFVLACAGMMELFAHGQDIADALGVERPRTDRVQFLVGFAVRVWDFGYQARGLTPPDVEFRFELTGPSGAVWTFGPEDSDQKITGDAVDFCLLVTRRRHRDDLALTAVGEHADHWLDIAQAYRGPAGEGRKPGQFK
ncbi:TIGR03084 family metal-binding protein [Amycolatopsis sp. cg5]|uniref:TIGR03084 family metal-binding protein n=1 Tax=Amycolatopsis sp. cg5 TaxID=3238802 RepID=UPI0035238996